MTISSNAHTVLVVESSKLQARIITEHIESVTSFYVQTADSLEEVEEIIATERESIFMAVMNLNLKDAPDGEAVDYVLSNNIPCIVLTSSYNSELRNRFIEKNVLDYFRKGIPEDMEEMVDLIRRIHNNSSVKVLIVDDSSTGRFVMRSLLERQNFNVLEAEDGQAALEVVNQHPDLSLMLTDYEMPIMDGFELVTKVREIHSRDNLAILGVSGHDSGAITAKFLKRGTNDFLKKPFEVEEFSWRVTNNLNELERIRGIKDAYSKDTVTGFYNLPYFLENGRPIYSSGSGAVEAPALAYIALDEVMEVNSRYGWDAGSQALTRVAALLEQRSLGWILSARSGNGFFVMANDGQKLKSELESAQAAVAKSAIKVGDSRFNISVSCVMTSSTFKNLDEAMSTLADRIIKVQVGGGGGFALV
jgi:PleD family two-component response regulator